MNLSVLAWKPANNADMVAFVAAAEPLLDGKLRHVGVVVEVESVTCFPSILSLARLQHKLHRLDLALCNSDDASTAAEAEALLSALCHVREAFIQVSDQEQRHFLQQARNRMATLGLPLPRLLDIKMFGQ